MKKMKTIMDKVKFADDRRTTEMIRHCWFAGDDEEKAVAWVSERSQLPYIPGKVKEEFARLDKIGIPSYLEYMYQHGGWLRTPVTDPAVLAHRGLIGPGATLREIIKKENDRTK